MKEYSINKNASTNEYCLPVQNLIDEGYLAANTEGKVINIKDTNTSLNDKKIRIKLIDDKVTAEIYS